MYPFVLAGKIVAAIKPLKQEYDFFLFLPTYGIGGAERANGAIVEAIRDQKVLIFFTRKSPNDKLLHLFKRPHTHCIDISKYTDNKWIYFANLYFRGVCAGYINAQKRKPGVFNGQCNFAYKLFPHLHNDINKVELIHTSERRFSWVTFPYVPFINARIMVADDIIQQHISYYEELGIPRRYQERIKKIFYTIHVPDQLPQREYHKPLKVYYAGRGGYQKRLEVLFEIVRRVQKEGLEIEFHFAGSFEDEVPSELKKNITWHGQISSTEEMYRLHSSMDVYLLTSRFEGFPLAIMEAMSCGVSIVATAVNGIPEHIVDDQNGLLIQSTDDSEIIEEGVDHLRKLMGNPDLRIHIAKTNHQYALKNFSKEIFERAYREVFKLKAE